MSCSLNRSHAPWEEARRRDVDFRAVGQQPTGSLELQHEGQMLFVVRYGSQRAVFDTPDPGIVDGRETYQAASEGHQIRVEIELHHCMDVMSGGIYYDRQVIVHLDNRLWIGAGALVASCKWFKIKHRPDRMPRNLPPAYSIW